MTVARELGEFLAGTKTTDLPAQAIGHAAMVIASTIASAAYGTNIRSAQIIRDLTREQADERMPRYGLIPASSCRSRRSRVQTPC